MANTASSGSGAAAVDQLSASSSRGPSLHGALKPNLAAPGTSIVSAAAVGLELLLPPEPVLVPAGGEVSLEVGLRLTAAQLSVGIGPDEQPQAFVMDRLEVDGQVELRAVDANGRPRTEIPAARMPVQVIPRRAAALRGSYSDPLMRSFSSRSASCCCISSSTWVSIFSGSSALVMRSLMLDLISVPSLEKMPIARRAYGINPGGAIEPGRRVRLIGPRLAIERAADR